MSDGGEQELAKVARGHYRQEYIRCGKARCKKCYPPEGTPVTGHGPYWYRYVWLGGRKRKRYVGKQLPEHVQTTLEAERADYRAVPTAVNAVGENQREHAAQLHQLAQEHSETSARVRSIGNNLSDIDARLRSIEQNLAEVKDLLIRALDRDDQG